MTGGERIGDHMTRQPVALDCHGSIAEAREVMASCAVHHLPVTDRGAPIGVASIRDLDRLQACKPTIEAEVLSLGEAMTPEPLSVAPEARLGDVVARMAAEGHEAALILERGELVGIFTVSDAMRLLSSLLATGQG